MKKRKPSAPIAAKKKLTKLDVANAYEETIRRNAAHTIERTEITKEFCDSCYELRAIAIRMLAYFSAAFLIACGGAGSSGTNAAADTWCDHAEVCGDDSAPTHEQCVESVSTVPAACLECLSATSCSYYWGQGPSSCELCSACCP